MSESPPRLSETVRNGAAIVLFAVTVVLAIGAVIYAVRADRRVGASSSGGGHVTLTAQEQQGRALFAQHCGDCHTLAAAEAVGVVGPNLDQLRPTAAMTLATIEHPPQGMPSGIVRGAGARAVAQFVGAVSGR